MERGNTFGQETITVHSGTGAISMLGPGYQDFLVPVDPVAKVLSIYCQRDSTYAGATPEVQILANGQVGVTAQTASGTGAGINAWEQISLPSITPTAKGIVTLRVISHDTNGGGKCIFDSFAIT
jgi:hypothetical protein